MLLSVDHDCQPCYCHVGDGDSFAAVFPHKEHLYNRHNFVHSLSKHKLTDNYRNVRTIECTLGAMLGESYQLVMRQY